MAIVSYSPIEPPMPGDLLIKVDMESGQVRYEICLDSSGKTQSIDYCIESNKWGDMLQGFVEL